MRHFTPRWLAALAILSAAPLPTVGAAIHPQPAASSPLADAPPPTHWESVAFDAARRRVVVFGGTRQIDNTWQDLNETWEWDGTRWHPVPMSAGGPAPRRAHALAYDPGERRIVLAGGVRTAPGSKTDQAYDDTWTIDGQRWRAGPALPVMSGHGLVYYGGTVADRGLVSDLWMRSGSTWTGWDSGSAQQARTTPAFTAARGGFIGVSVGDLDATVRWYTEKLGLTVVMRPPRIEKSAAVILEGGNLIVELMRHDDAVPLSTAAPSITRNYLVTGIFKAGIIVEDFDKAIAELRARNVPIAIGPFPATAEQRANAIIRDNEGNYIQLFGAR